MPGSHWHCYVYDPDGHTNELYYGIEQVGWNEMSEVKEVAEALHVKDVEIFSGYCYAGG